MKCRRALTSSSDPRPSAGGRPAHHLPMLDPRTHRLKDLANCSHFFTLVLNNRRSICSLQLSMQRLLSEGQEYGRPTCQGVLWATLVFWRW